MAKDSAALIADIELLKGKFQSGLFIDHDTRSINLSAIERRNSQIRPQILALQRFFRALDQDLLKSLHDSELEILGQAAVSISESMRLLQNRLQSSGQVDQNVAADIDRNYTIVSATVSPMLLSQVLANEGRSADIVRRLKADVEEFLRSAENKSNELTESIRNELSEAAIGKNSNFFHNEYERYKIQSLVWGTGTALWFLATMILIIIFSINFELVGRYLSGVKTYWPEARDDILLIQLGFSKIVLIGVATYVGSILTRAFLSSLNLAANNKQRAVALDTYRFLLDGAKSDEDRQAIVQRAAEAVFMIPETGLIKGGSGSDSPPLSAIINLPKLSSGT